MRVQLHHLADVLTERPDSKQLAKEIAAYLLETGRTGELNSLARDMVQARARQGIVEVTAVSARTLSESARTDIEELAKRLYPNAKRITLNERHDVNLVGGTRIEFPDQQLDLTIRSKLNRLKALTGSERTI